MINYWFSESQFNAFNIADFVYFFIGKTCRLVDLGGFSMATELWLIQKMILIHTICTNYIWNIIYQCPSFFPLICISFQTRYRNH